jgi:hypothetical protein
LIELNLEFHPAETCLQPKGRNRRDVWNLDYQNIEPPHRLRPQRVTIGILAGKVSVVTGARGAARPPCCASETCKRPRAAFPERTSSTSTLPTTGFTGCGKENRTSSWKPIETPTGQSERKRMIYANIAENHPSLLNRIEAGLTHICSLLTANPEKLINLFESLSQRLCEKILLSGTLPSNT